ncbi:hypothetical protein QWJ90_01215 [Microbacterium oryzae]|uniref:hypothetical protein n=1 Tax=Microbacterium oryzae TaxID=743009 RepID=UPI0025B0668C|nr:hypothetical protein [Microbacterium oryzae]MDN3309541.1 hypothetical protein [Microbacterium oryzae]
MKTVARRSAVEPLPVRLSDGSTPVVVALPEDTLGSVATRVNGFGGEANVFVAFPEKLTLIDFRVSKHEGETIEQLAQSTTSMAMYVDYLYLNPSRPSTITVDIGTDAIAPSVMNISYAF